MPSPVCEVRDGAGSFTSTTSGKNVTPANTVTIRLASSTGVSTWSIQCITTDETSDAAAVTSSLTVDSVLKTATFTAPVAGKAYRFQSIINGGIGPNGTVQASYSTTFCIYTLTAELRRVHAVDETFESDATFGWVGDMNDIIRNPAGTFTPSGTGIPHVVAGVYDAATSLIVNADVHASAAIAPSKLGATGSNGNVVRQAAGAVGLGTIDLASANCVGATILAAANGGTGLSALASGVATFLGTPSSANFAAMITNETGTGLVMLNNSPTLITPRLRDLDDTHNYVFAVSNLAADRTVTWPLLTSGDTLVFEAHTQTLTNKTLTSPTISGPTISGTTTFSGSAIQATGNARARAYSDIANVQTTDATVTSLFTWTILDEAATKVVAEVCGCRSTGAETAAYTRQVRIKRDGGTVTVGTVDTPFTSEETSTWDCTIDNSTSTGRVRVTGVAAVTIDWGGVTTRLEVSHA